MGGTPAVSICNYFAIRPLSNHLPGMWTLDPIDGTKGFLRGEQYAVCLALLVDGKAQVSVMGCPNLPTEMNKPEGDKGCLFIAVRGQGAEQVRSLLFLVFS